MTFGIMQLARLRRADAEAKRNLRETERAFAIQRSLAEAEIASKLGELGKNAEERKRNLDLHLVAHAHYQAALLRDIEAQEKAAACAVDLQIALDAREERRLAVRERFTEVLALAYNIPLASTVTDDALIDGEQEQIVGELADEGQSEITDGVLHSYRETYPEAFPPDRGAFTIIGGAGSGLSDEDTKSTLQSGRLEFPDRDILADREREENGEAGYEMRAGPANEPEDFIADYGAGDDTIADSVPDPIADAIAEASAEVETLGGRARRRQTNAGLRITGCDTPVPNTHLYDAASEEYRILAGDGLSFYDYQALDEREKGRGVSDGLDITAHQTIEILPAHEVADDCYDEEDHVRTLCHSSFAQSFRGLPIVQIDADKGVIMGPCVRTSGKRFEFRAGSYSGYNAWRDNLATVALGVDALTFFLNVGLYRDQPFFELINFADNEGVIGPEACRDLARDFAEHPEVRVKLNEWDADLFDKWGAAFALASGSGIVVFH